MSTTTKNGNGTAPALIVFGTPKGARSPHAAWFRASYAERARLAAQRQSLQPWPSTPTISEPPQPCSKRGS